MLRSEDFNQIEVLVDRLAEKNLKIQAKAGTPLAALNSALKGADLILTQNHEPGTQMDFGRFEYREANIQASKEAGGDGIYLHDHLQETHGSGLADIVSAMLSQAQNEAVPLIGEIIKQTQDAIGVTIDAQVTPVDILRQSYPLFLSSPAVDTLAGHYADVNPTEVKIPKELSAVESAVEFLKQGSVFTDSDIDAFVEEVGVETVNAVFDSFFVSTGGWDYGDKDLNVYTGKPVVMLLVFLFCCNLSKAESIPGLENPSAFKSAALNAKAELGRRICRVIKLREQNRESNKLVVSFPDHEVSELYAYGSSFIVVNDDVYVNWLEKGGEADILLGSFVSTKETDFDALIADGAKYSARWKEVSAYLAEQARSKLLATTKAALIGTIRSYIGSTEPERLTAPKSVLQSKLVEVVNTTASSMYGDLDRVAMRLVCRVFYPHLLTEKILTEMDHQSKINPDLDARQLATIASCVIWADWAFDTMVDVIE